MRVWRLERNEHLYSCNVYLLLGDWSRIGDVNTLIDVGADPAIMPFLERAPTGVGKKRVDLVLLTHRHYDHVVMLPAIQKAYAPTVAGWGPIGYGVDRVLEDGERVHVADDVLEVIHAPAHTDDSVCFYSESQRALFVGDTPVLITSPEHTCTPEFVAALARMTERPVDTIYFGHGDALTERCNERLADSLRVARVACR
jgi:glyoxylase-like metal-dependent hydrolase (beta-lactamase superfamily II)